MGSREGRINPALFGRLRGAPVGFVECFSFDGTSRQHASHFSTGLPKRSLWCAFRASDFQRVHALLVVWRPAAGGKSDGCRGPVGPPLFLSGLVFSLRFRDKSRPAQGLHVNLLGAAVGGVLENVVMIGGRPILGVPASVLYGFSAVC
jgi:hypothetical protein